MFGFGFDMRHGYPGERGRGAGSFGGRKLGSSDLQLLILALLAEKPRHGYEIIKALDERSNGYYSPSPGMVYPALTYLEELGHATVAAEGAKKLYSITRAASRIWSAIAPRSTPSSSSSPGSAARWTTVRRALSDREGGDAEDFDLPGAGGSARRVALEIRQARRNLKSALIEKYSAPVAEQRRIAQILERAAAESADKLHHRHTGRTARGQLVL